VSKLTGLAEQVSFMNPEKVGFRLQSKPLGPDTRLRFEFLKTQSFLVILSIFVTGGISM
jgi:hypothetical protein